MATLQERLERLYQTGLGTYNHIQRVKEKHQRENLYSLVRYMLDELDYMREEVAEEGDAVRTAQLEHELKAKGICSKY